MMRNHAEFIQRNCFGYYLFLIYKIPFDIQQNHFRQRCSQSDWGGEAYWQFQNCVCNMSSRRHQIRHGAAYHVVGYVVATQNR